MANEGLNANGSEFAITLGQTANVRDGYHVVFGELVDGQDVLDKLEESVTRLGNLAHDVKIEECGTR